MTEATDPVHSVAPDGLTKREYFAAMAMQGMCVNFPEMGNAHGPLIAKQSVEIADALIEALNK